MPRRPWRSSDAATALAGPSPPDDPDLEAGAASTPTPSGRAASTSGGSADPPPTRPPTRAAADPADVFHDVELGDVRGGGAGGAVRGPGAGPPPGDPTPAAAEEGDPATGACPSAANKPTNLSPSPSGTYAECRICLEAGTPADLVAPCNCTGSVRTAHLKCLQTWVEERRGLMTCEICGGPYSPAVAPLLAEAAARGEARRVEAAEAAAAAAAGAGLGGGAGADGRPDGAAAAAAGGCLGSSRSRAWMAAAAVFAVALALLYVVLFVGGDHQPSFWAVLLLRILSFVLPMYLVVQACLTFRRYRQARLAAGLA